MVFADVVNRPKNEIFRYTEALGRGLGGFYTCGVVSAMAVIVGLLNSDGDIENPGTTKFETYDIIAPMVEKIEEEVGTIICREIKGIDTEEPSLACNDCIAIGVGLVEEYLSNRELK